MSEPPVYASGSSTFSGLDRSGAEQTSTFGGQAYADAKYGQLKTYVNARLENTFYNPENAANDSPNIYIAAGQSSFSDTFGYIGAFIMPTFKVRYTFFVDGEISGFGAYGSLLFKVDNNPSENLYLGNAGPIARYWTTKSYELSSNLKHTISTNFLAGYQVNTRSLSDGLTVEGAALFGSTVTLSAIRLYDEQDKEVYGWELDSESGTQYSTVPEPGTLAGLAAGALWFMRRRSKRYSRTPPLPD